MTIPPQIENKKKTANQPIRAVVPVNTVTKKEVFFWVLKLGGTSEEEKNALYLQIVRRQCYHLGDLPRPAARVDAHPDVNGDQLRGRCHTSHCRG